MALAHVADRNVRAPFYRRSSVVGMSCKRQRPKDKPKFNPFVRVAVLHGQPPRKDFWKFYWACSSPHLWEFASPINAIFPLDGMVSKSLEYLVGLTRKNRLCLWLVSKQKTLRHLRHRNRPHLRHRLASGENPNQSSIQTSANNLELSSRPRSVVILRIILLSSEIK